MNEYIMPHRQQRQTQPLSATEKLTALTIPLGPIIGGLVYQTSTGESLLTPALLTVVCSASAAYSTALCTDNMTQARTLGYATGAAVGAFSVETLGASLVGAEIGLFAAKSAKRFVQENLQYNEGLEHVGNAQNKHGMIMGAAIFAAFLSTAVSHTVNEAIPMSPVRDRNEHLSSLLMGTLAGVTIGVIWGKEVPIQRAAFSALIGAEIGTIAGRKFLEVAQPNDAFVTAAAEAVRSFMETVSDVAYGFVDALNRNGVENMARLREAFQR